MLMQVFVAITFIYFYSTALPVVQQSTIMLLFSAISVTQTDEQRGNMCNLLMLKELIILKISVLKVNYPLFNHTVLNNLKKKKMFTPLYLVLFMKIYIIHTD